MKTQKRKPINFCISEKGDIKDIIKKSGLLKVQASPPRRLMDMAKEKSPKLFSKLADYKRMSAKEKKLHRIYQVELKLGAYDDKEVLKKLKDTPGVEFADFERVYETYSHYQPNDPEVQPDSVNGYVFADHGHQYGLEYIQARCAWHHSRGEGVVIGVVDTGVDHFHEDLRNQMAPGYNFGDNNRPDSWDINGHGTAVAGVIVAEGNNSKGIVGTAPKAKVMPLNAARDGDHKLETTPIIWCFYAAYLNNVRLINCSFGPAVDGATNLVIDPVIESAIDFLHDEGHILIFAAGDEKANMPLSHPGNSEKVICVGGIKQPIWIEGVNTASRYPTSNYGPAVDIAAPAWKILTTKRASHDYHYQNGTSFAAAFVSGTIALLLSKAPKLSFDSVKYLLRRSANHLSSSMEIGPGLNACNLLTPASSLANRHCVVTTGNNKFAVNKSGTIRRFFYKAPNGWQSELIQGWGAPVVPCSLDGFGPGFVKGVNTDGIMVSTYDNNGDITFAKIESTWGLVPGTLRHAENRHATFALNKWGDIVVIKWQNGQHVMTIISTWGGPIVPHSLEVVRGEQLVGITAGGRAFITYGAGNSISFALVPGFSDLDS